MWCSLLVDVKYLPREKLLRYYDCFGKFLIPFVSKILCEKMCSTIPPMHMLFTIISLKQNSSNARSAQASSLMVRGAYVYTFYRVNMHHKFFK